MERHHFLWQNMGNITIAMAVFNIYTSLRGYLCFRGSLFVRESVGRKSSANATIFPLGNCHHGGFLKWGYPEIINLKNDISVISQPFWIAPFMETPHMSICK